MMRDCLARAAAIGLICGCLAGCLEYPDRISVPSMDPDEIGSQALVMYDANKDGAIAGEELDQCPGLKRGLPQIDGDNDGKVTAEEIAERIRRYQKDKLGIMGFIGHVTMDGKPLTDAEVTLVPEEFMGSSIESAKATTDPGGDFKVKTEGIDPRIFGARTGIYRIRISKKDASGNETIPAKYNSETTLGVELGYDSPVVRQGLDVNLSSRG